MPCAQPWPEAARRLGATQPRLIWLTGSPQFHLMAGVSASLAGRVAVQHLAGLTRRIDVQHFAALERLGLASGRAE